MVVFEGTVWHASPNFVQGEVFNWVKIFEGYNMRFK